MRKQFFNAIPSSINSVQLATRVLTREQRLSAAADANTITCTDPNTHTLLTSKLFSKAADDDGGDVTRLKWVNSSLYYTKKNSLAFQAALADAAVNFVRLANVWQMLSTAGWKLSTVQVTSRCLYPIDNDK